MIGRFVDVERVAVAGLTAALREPAVRVAVQLPDPFTDAVAAAGFVRVQRAPGSEAWPSTLARVDVECFATSRSALWRLAARVHDAVAAMQGATASGVRIDATETTSDAAAVSWSPTIYRSIATYRLHFTTAA